MINNALSLKLKTKKIRNLTNKSVTFEHWHCDFFVFRPYLQERTAATVGGGAPPRLSHRASRLALLPYASFICLTSILCLSSSVKAATLALR